MGEPLRPPASASSGVRYRSWPPASPDPRSRCAAAGPSAPCPACATPSCLQRRPPSQMVRAHVRESCMYDTTGSRTWIQQGSTGCEATGLWATRVGSACGGPTGGRRHRGLRTFGVLVHGHSEPVLHERIVGECGECVACTMSAVSATFRHGSRFRTQLGSSLAAAGGGAGQWVPGSFAGSSWYRLARPLQAPQKGERPRCVQPPPLGVCDARSCTTAPVRFVSLSRLMLLFCWDPTLHRPSAFARIRPRGKRRTSRRRRTRRTLE